MSGKNMMQRADSPAPTTDLVVEAGYNTNSGFDLVQRVAKMFSISSLVPTTYQGNVANCVIALDMAKRMNADPLMVMQNMYIVHGRPSWSSQFLISSVNASGRFSPMRYKETGTKGTDSEGIIAWAKDLTDGEILEGPEVTIAMSKKEGWFQKNGSKWQTMPALMLRYRAATFFARLYAPELTMGIRTSEEAADIAQEDLDVGPAPYAESGPVYEEPSFPTAEGPEEEPDETPKESAQKQPAQEDAGLTPVVDMPKPSLMAEVNSHADKPYFDAVLDTCKLGDETDYTQYPVSALRDFVTALRETAEQGA